jgi:hypothetical protein
VFPPKICAVSTKEEEEEEEELRDMKVEVEEEEESEGDGGGGKEATRCRARREGKKTGVRERAVVISHSEGLGRGSEEGLAHFAASLRGATSCSVARLWGPAASSKSARLGPAKFCEVLCPTHFPLPRRKRVKTLPLLSLLSPVPLSHPELSAQQPRLSFPITDHYFYYYYEVVAQRARLTIPVPAV